MQNKSFEFIARGIILRGTKILLCKPKGGEYYFFPGGHVEIGETSDEALAREIDEELHVGVKKAAFIGLVENYYTEEGKSHHEINIIFQVWLSSLDFKVTEKHIEFEWIDIKELKKVRVLPEHFSREFQKWMKNKKIFYISERH